MVVDLLKRVFGTQHERDMKRLQPLVEAINSYEREFKGLANEGLKAKTPGFLERIDRGESLDEILPEAFALCREVSSRVLNMRHYDVQMVGGIILHQGAIAEMKTGEGKTLVATLPLYLNALSKKGAHLVTVNDYLAKRDEEWMGPMYHFLGLTTGTITHDLTDIQRKKAYGADITYGTNNEFGFDYLRDNMKFNFQDFTQRDYYFSIVDECDSILIDESRTPLIISGPAEKSTSKYHEVNKMIPHLKKNIHFTMEEKSRTVSLTEEGNEKVEQLLGLDNLYDVKNIGWLHHVCQGLKAFHLFKKDVDYMVRDGEVIIIDEFTGRLMPGRRWSEGIHQAIEAKERVKVKSENQTLATITFQNFFRMYKKLSGMTGTAETEAEEFKKIYGLKVFVVPTHKPLIRKDQEDLIYKTEEEKFKAILTDIKEKSKAGQPVLVGTISIEKSEKLSRLLKKEGLMHHILNAKHHEREAEIIAQAGRFGALTIATNMAGRGTDIQLGGNPEALNLKEPEELRSESLGVYKKKAEQEKGRVIQSGGLYIIGTERHESRRIDNQLRGRSGRQGDPGETRFYLSLEDDLMRIFNGERIQKIMSTLKIPDDEPITARMVSRAIEGAQKKVEGHQFDIRKHLLEYDNVMNQQRQSIYSLRKKVLLGTELNRIMLDLLADVTSDVLDRYANESVSEAEWDLKALKATFLKKYNVDLDFENQKLSSQVLTKEVSQIVRGVFEEQKKRLEPHTQSIQKFILLQSIDLRWKEHLAFNDHLKEGINLRAYAQKDPLIEYKKESFHGFEKMSQVIREESIEKFLKIKLVEENLEEDDLEQRVSSNLNEKSLSYAGGGSEELNKSQELYNRFLDLKNQFEEKTNEFQKENRTRGHSEVKLNRSERRRLERAQKRRK